MAVARAVLPAACTNETAKSAKISENCNSHFELMELFRAPYTRIVPEDPKNLPKCTEAYFRSLKQFKWTNLLDYAENSAYIRDYIMPLLKGSLESPDPKLELTRHIGGFKGFAENVELCHEFWKFQMDLYTQGKVELAHHVYNAYDDVMQATKSITMVDEDNPELKAAMQASVNHAKMVDEKYANSYNSYKFSKKFQKDFPVQSSVEDCLDFCSRQLITMKSAMQRFIQVSANIQDRSVWYLAIGNCSAITVDIHIINLWMRKLVEIRAEKDPQKRIILMGRLASVLERKMYLSDPELLKFEGMKRMSERWMFLRLHLVKKASELSCEVCPAVGSYFKDTVAIYSLAEMRILWSLWNQLGFPYDKENYFKVIYDHEGYECTYQMANLRRIICDLSGVLILLAFTKKMDPSSYQEFFDRCINEWPIVLGDQLGSTLKECHPLSNDEWNVLVTPMKRLERLAARSVVINLSRPEKTKPAKAKKVTSHTSSSDENWGSDYFASSSETESSFEEPETAQAFCEDDKSSCEAGGAIENVPNESEGALNTETVSDNYPNETVQEETERLMKEHQATIDHFNRLEMEEGWELVRKRKEARLIKGKVTCTSNVEPIILLADLGDFMALFPEAARVHEINRKNRTVVKVMNRRNKKQRFRWALDPSVVIDFKTYKFLAAVFVPAYASRKTLNFDNFEDCVRALGGTVSGTVYNFPRRLEVDGKIYITPPGEVHPEHKSSDVSHTSMSIFLGYAGLHVSLFEPIDYI